MALTKLNTHGIGADVILAEDIASNAVTIAELGDQAVSEAKMQISNAGTNGQFLQKQSGNTGGLTWATVSTTPLAGEIIETLTGICDGRQVTVQSGTYTLPSVTSQQGLTTSHATIDGSSISYTPPSTAKWVKYRFEFHWENSAGSGISHFKINLDGTDITDSKFSFVTEYEATYHTGELWVPAEWIINCNAGSTSLADGNLSSWTSAKVIKVMGREYGGNHAAIVNSNNYWDGGNSSGSTLVVQPRLTIQAIA